MTDPHRDHPAEDDLVELALGHRPAAVESVLAGHLAACPSCRATYDEIAAALDTVLPASPAVGPPAGFEDRVLAALGMRERPARRPGRGRWPVTAAAVAGLVIGGAVGAVLGAATEDPERSAAESAYAAALVTGSGETVGAVLAGGHADDEVLVLQVEDGPPGIHYTCRLVLADGSTRSAGDWVLPASGDAVWVLGRAPEGTTGVELVTDAGTVWSRARLAD